MGLPAARVADNHLCPMSTGPTPHVGGPILPPGDPKTMTNSKPMARGTDRALCTGPVDFIVTGAATVLIGKKPAARSTDKTMHGGSIAVGSTNVMIGGPATGVILGNPTAGLAACQAAAAGRTSGSSQQSYNNCGIESSRQIINQAGGNVSEDNLMNTALSNGWAQTGATRFLSGGTQPGGIQSILSSGGVASTQQPANMQNLAQSVAEGRGVVSAHQAGRLWGTTQSGGHAILVTGVEYDANGKLATIHYNDTGTGQCGNTISATQFQNSQLAGWPRIVTSNPIW